MRYVKCRAQAYTVGVIHSLMTVLPGWTAILPLSLKGMLAFIFWDVFKKYRKVNIGAERGKSNQPVWVETEREEGKGRGRG